MAEVTLISFDNVMQVLQEYAQYVRNAYQDNLIRSDSLASGELLNSVEYIVETDGQAFEVKLSLAEYWKYVEYDTRPHWPPREAILRWVTVKPVIPRPDREGRIPRPESLAYLIARHISEYGTRGTGDLEDAKRKGMDEFAQRLSEAFGRDMEETFLRYLKDIAE